MWLYWRFHTSEKLQVFLEGLHCRNGIGSRRRSPEDDGDGNGRGALKRLILPWPHVPLLCMISGHARILRRILVPA